MPFYSDSINFCAIRAKFHFYIIFALSICTANGLAQEKFTTGKIIDSVQIENSKGETFSLYLPRSHYENTGLHSIVFVFDPVARGSIGVSPFMETAEQFGHIIVCSNNSRNGPANENFEIANRLFAHIFNTFQIDEKQLFLAGFSGGSRLVSSMATLTNKFAGVIACGAGFSTDTAYTPSFQEFIYAGICGNEDMNYQEMRTNKSILDKLQFKNTIFTFNGGHRWPPKKEINKAFRWIHAIKAKNDDVLEETLAVELEETKELKDSGELLLAGENYERIIKSFKGLNAIKYVQEDYEALLASKEYKNAVKEQQRAFELEADISKKLFDRFFVEVKKPEKANMAWWSKEFQKLDKLAGSGSEQKNKMVKRIKYKVFAAAFSRGNPNLFASNEGQMAYYKKLRQIIYPN